jgi:predicted Fe-S protein YdhL (DUF1289 family)
MQPLSNDRPAQPASPCINVCMLDATGHCLGCLRTLDEIARWRDMSAGEQWRLIDDLHARRAVRERAAANQPPDGVPNER